MKNFEKFIIIFVQIFSIYNCDWIKISQEPEKLSIQQKSTPFNTDRHLTSILDKEDRTLSSGFEKISFGNNSQKIIVTGTENLKSSSKVIVPFRNESNNYKSDHKFYDNFENQQSVFSDSRKFKTQRQKFENNENILSSKESLSTSPVGKSKIHKNIKTNEKKIEQKKSQNPSFHGFLEYLKSMQNNLLSSATSGIREKIRKLTKLKDDLLINIEDRVKALWVKDKSRTSTKRTKRGIFEESHSSFPSAETALMTINFLTFAVFLIKLVLQVINTVKSKHYNFNGFSVNAVETFKSSKLRSNARHFGDDANDDLKTEQILKSIEKLKS